MPLDQHRVPHQPSLALPPDLKATDEFFVIRFTGEVFREYEDYTRALTLYRQRIWTCEVSGKDKLTYEEALASECAPPQQHVPAAAVAVEKPKPMAQFPEPYVKPCLAIIHGATSRLDDLVNSLLSFLRTECIVGEEVQLGPKDSRVPAVIVAESPDPPANPADKEYVVSCQGRQRAIPVSRMARLHQQLTKAATKAWLNDVARQQSLGVKGMTCVWLVRPELLERFGIPDVLPEHIAQHLAKTSKRREQRQRAKQRAKEQGEGGAGSGRAQAPLPPIPGLGPSPEVVQAQQAAYMRARAALLESGNATPEMLARIEAMNPARSGASMQRGATLANDVHSKEVLHQLAQSGASHQQLQHAAMQIQLQALASIQDAGPMAAPAPPKETLEESEARLEHGSLKKAVFTVLRAAGPQGLTVADLLEHVKQHGFEWGENTRVGKSSIASTCGHDDIFLRLGPGRFTLRALPGALDHVTSAARRPDAAGPNATASSAGRLETDGIETLLTTRNSLKCGKCMRINHPQWSPLVLCDFCPKSFHIACLEAPPEALPEHKWACPKCVDRHAHNLKKLAEKKIEALNRVSTGAAPSRAAQNPRVVEGPREPTWIASTPRDACLLQEALAVVEFLFALGPVTDCKAVSLLDLQHACRHPLDSSNLPDIYITLIRNCLLETITLEAPAKRSRAKRWARVISEHTWPDILRRYLLASRANRPISDADVASDDVIALSPDQVAVKAAVALGSTPWWRLAPDLHLRLLNVLCDDVLQSTAMRTEVNARFDTLVQLNTEKYHQQAVDRKREKEVAKERKDQLQRIRDLEARAEAESLSPAVKPRPEELADARAQRDQMLADAEAERREQAEVLRKRDEEFEAQCEASIVRIEPLGWDRHHRRYWLLRASAACLWVESPDGDRVGLLDKPSEVADLMSRLIDRGAPEKPLLQALESKKDALLAALSEGGHPQAPIGFILDAIPRLLPHGGTQPAEASADGDGAAAPGEPQPLEELDSRAVTAAVRLGVQDLDKLLKTLVACNLAAPEVAKLQARLGDVRDVEALLSVMKAIEALTCRLAEGLPRDADDRFMVQPVLDAELYQSEFVLPPARVDTHEDDDDHHGRAHDAVPSKTAAGAAPAIQRIAMPLNNGADAGDQESAPLQRKVVASLDELDDSDAEPECKSGSTYDEHGNRYPNKPLRLWRTARERGVWLRDLRRAELTGSLSGALFLAAVLLDRSHPLTVRVLNKLNAERTNRDVTKNPLLEVPERAFKYAASDRVPEKVARPAADRPRHSTPSAPSSHRKRDLTTTPGETPSAKRIRIGHSGGALHSASPAAAPPPPAAVAPAHPPAAAGGAAPPPRPKSGVKITLKLGGHRAALGVKAKEAAAKAQAEANSAIAHGQVGGNGISSQS